jgi:hypothetical protein
MEPHGKKGDDTAYQKSPGKRVEYVEYIVKLPSLAKTIGRKRFSHIQVIIIVLKLFKGGFSGPLSSGTAVDTLYKNVVYFGHD